MGTCPADGPGGDGGQGLSAGEALRPSGSSLYGGHIRMTSIAALAVPKRLPEGAGRRRPGRWRGRTGRGRGVSAWIGRVWGSAASRAGVCAGCRPREAPFSHPIPDRLRSGSRPTRPHGRARSAPTLGPGTNLTFLAKLIGVRDEELKQHRLGVTSNYHAFLRGVRGLPVAPSRRYCLVPIAPVPKAEAHSRKLPTLSPSSRLLGDPLCNQCSHDSVVSAYFHYCLRIVYVWKKVALFFRRQGA